MHYQRLVVHGDVRSHRPPNTRGSNEERFWSYVEKTDTCWNWTGSLKSGGYGQFTWYEEGQPRRNLSAHRLSAEWAGMDVDGLFVCHHCDNRRCVNPAHLFAGTHQDNMDDMKLKGRRVNPVGVAVNRGVLNDQKVIEIRRLRQEGQSYTQIGRTVGASPEAVGAVVRRETWRHVL